MAIYHFSGNIVSRANGSNILNSYAYQSCTKQHDETTGLTFDFTKKRGHIAGGVLLCKNAPSEYSDASVLFQEIERYETAADAQLARTFDAAVPNEFTHEQQIELIKDFAQRVWVDAGMCVAWDLHEAHKPKRKNKNINGDNIYRDNDHAHFKLTMREIDENGNWVNKAVKGYLCRNNLGEEKYLTAAQFKNSEGFEKVYKYNSEGEILKLTPSEASEKGLKNNRVDKNPISKKIYVNNWDSTELFNDWRRLWAEISNEHLEKNGFETRIDHRSLKEQGIEREAQKHVGSSATAIERKEKEKHLELYGNLDHYQPVTERAKLNQEIKDLNAQLNKLDQELEATQKDLIQMRKVLRTMIDLEREKDFMQIDEGYTHEQREHFEMLYDAQYKQYELAYKNHHQTFLAAYKELNTTEQGYANYLIQKFDKNVYVDEYQQTLENLKENSVVENYAYNIYNLALEEPIAGSKNIIECERVCEVYEENLNTLGRMQRNYHSIEREISEIENKLIDLTIFNDFKGTQRNKLNKNIESKKDELQKIDKIIDEEVIKCAGESSLKLFFDQKIRLIKDYFINRIDYIKTIINGYKKQLVDVEYTIKKAFGFEIHKVQNTSVKAELSQIKHQTEQLRNDSSERNDNVRKLMELNNDERN